MMQVAADRRVFDLGLGDDQWVYGVKPAAHPFRDRPTASLILVGSQKETDALLKRMLAWDLVAGGLLVGLFFLI
jgi:hypothetical protein